MSDITEHPVQFSGDARTYFGIWIVNIALSIITFGIYSAWAKVRTEKYFHQQTTIDGRHFDYHATGKQILIGRIIVVIGFVIFSVVSAIPIGAIVMFGLLIFLSPFFVQRALRFRYGVTSWSGVRFSHSGTYGGAFMSYVVMAALGFITLFLAQPFAARAQYGYRVDHIKLGQSRFSLEMGVWPFYRAALLSLLWIVVAGAIAASLAWSYLATTLGAETLMRMAEGDDLAALYPIIAGYALAFVVILPATFIYQAFVRNAVYDAIEIEGGHSIRSTVRAGNLIWIALSNAVLVLGSLFLLLPWAKVRMARYLAENTTLLAAGSLDSFVAGEVEAGGTIGDAYGDLEGLDLGVAI